MYDETNDPENYGPVYSPNANDALDGLSTTYDAMAKDPNNLVSEADFIPQHYKFGDLEGLKNFFLEALWGSNTPKEILEFSQKLNDLIKEYDKKMDIEAINTIEAYLPVYHFEQAKKAMQLAMNEFDDYFEKEQNEREKDRIHEEKLKKRSSEEKLRDFFLKNLFYEKDADAMLQLCKDLAEVVNKPEYKELKKNYQEMNAMFNHEFLDMIYGKSADTAVVGMYLAKKKINEDNKQRNVDENKISPLNEEIPF